jgi:membrane-associated phospholipid phosphatase
MSQANLLPADRSCVGRLLAAGDRLPGLGGGRTHVAALFLFFAGALSLYLVVLKLRGPVAVYRTRVEWDALFPFTPWWIWVYLLPYIVGPLLVGVMSRLTFAWYLRRASLVVLVSLLIFLIVPTQTIRPLENPDNERHLGDDWTSDVYRLTVAVDDPPANAAPSLHVSLSCLLAWALAYDRPRWWAAALLGAFVVWLSTLYTAQHHLLDVVTGVILASLAAIGRPKVG